MESDSVLVLIRFPLTRFQAAKNTLAKHFSNQRIYLGAVAGLSEQIQVLEGAWPTNKGVAMLSFPSLKEAELWKVSSPEIRQHDWLDGVDFIIVPTNQLPREGVGFIEILEFSVKEIDKFMLEYIQPVMQHMLNYEASAGIVSTDRILKCKGQWSPEYLVINFWPSIEQFEKAHCSDAYLPIKQKRLCYAETNSIFFEMVPLFRKR